MAEALEWSELDEKLLICEHGGWGGGELYFMDRMGSVFHISHFCSFNENHLLINDIWV